MPLPLIPLIVAGVAAAGAAYSGKKLYDTYSDKLEADEYRDEASTLYNKASISLNETQERAQKSFEELGSFQAQIVETTLKQYQELVDKLIVEDSIQLNEILGKESIEALKNTKEAVIDLTTTLGGVVAGGTAGAMAGFGAFGAAGLFASASTGTAISSLSGVAATNATLAFFGGGSLAAGGLGMAGGMWVLGGIVAAPVLAIFSKILANNAEGVKHDALSYYLSIKSLAEAMQTEELTWKSIENETSEKMLSLKTLDLKFAKVIGVVEWILDKKGEKVSKWEATEQNEFKTMAQLAQSIVNIINAPIMHDSDPLTLRIKEHQSKIKNLIEEINIKWKE